MMLGSLRPSVDYSHSHSHRLLGVRNPDYKWSAPVPTITLRLFGSTSTRLSVHQPVLPLLVPDLTTLHRQIFNRIGPKKFQVSSIKYQEHAELPLNRTENLHLQHQWQLQQAGELLLS